MDENKILTTGDANKLLYRFLKWKQSYLVLRPHDMAFLLVYVHFQAMTGYTEENWPTWSLFQQPKDGLGGKKKKPKFSVYNSMQLLLGQLADSGIIKTPPLGGSVVEAHFFSPAPRCLLTIEHTELYQMPLPGCAPQVRVCLEGPPGFYECSHLIFSIMIIKTTRRRN